MKVLFVSSEIYPLAKTGGLADVSAALPKALAMLGANTADWFEWWMGRLKNEMKKQNVEHADDSVTITLKVGDVRLLIYGMSEWKAELRQYAK